jgi:hypothetical protein
MTNQNPGQGGQQGGGSQKPGQQETCSGDGVGYSNEPLSPIRFEIILPG